MLHKSAGKLEDKFNLTGDNSIIVLHQREGHCRVPRSHREQNFRLGQWVSAQRQGKDIVSPDRRQRLDALDFVWDALAASWEEGFRLLAIYHQREGHCRVPDIHREGGYPLGRWVGTQRTTQSKLSPDRRERLDALGVCVEGALSGSDALGYRVTKQDDGIVAVEIGRAHV